jgi:uncharacterized protein CbrC (UPF0167 family)
MSPDDERLEMVLRESLAHPDLPDAGFAQRVVAILPSARAIPYYHGWVALGWIGSAIGVCAALGACIPWSRIEDASAHLGQSPNGLPNYAWITVGLAATLAGGVAALYFRESPLDS